MAITVVRRHEWVQPEYPFGPNTPLFPAWRYIKFLVVHWPGYNINVTTKDKMKSVMQSVQRIDKTQEGFDFEYNWALDPWGVFWEGRGFQYKNAANNKNIYQTVKTEYGTSDINGISMSVNIICNLDQGATPAQQEAMREMQYEVWLRNSGVWLPWKPHLSIAGTACPGPINTALTTGGMFNYVPGEVVNVDTSNKIVVFQPKDCLAQFIGHADANGNVLELWWIQTAQDQAVRDNHLRAGAVVDTGPATQGRFRNCILRGPIPHGDTYPWTAADFWKVTTV